MNGLDADRLDPSAADQGGAGKPIVAAMSESNSPTDDEVVAIMAGVEALWPKPMVVADATPERSTAWRFSGRWWAKPVSARRDRPFR